MTKTNVTGKSSPFSSNPYLATLGLRIEPAPVDSGINVRLAVDVRLVPLYIFKTVDAFVGQMGHYLREALQEGMYGWQVIDCTVTVIDCGYRAPGTTAADFRKLTALLVARALERGRTQVYEPMAALHLEVRIDAMSRVLRRLARVGASIQAPVHSGGVSTIEARLAVARVQDLQRALPALTSGEGVLEWDLAGYQPVTGAPPTRLRTTPTE
jgi:ribosomal protection tetracycline resistance protein